MVVNKIQSSYIWNGILYLSLGKHIRYSEVPIQLHIQKTSVHKCQQQSAIEQRVFEHTLGTPYERGQGRRKYLCILQHHYILGK